MQTHGLKPERPSDAGIAEETPDRSGVEGATLLANDAFPTLRRAGFNRRQVRLWAERFVAETRSGDVDGFIRWIGEQERAAAKAPPA